jgi:hypothetical protein
MTNQRAEIATQLMAAMLVGHKATKNNIEFAAHQSTIAADELLTRLAVPTAAGLTSEQGEAIASAVRSLRYGAHPMRSPHADDLVRLFPEIKL